MDSTQTVALEVLTDDELDAVVGGGAALSAEKTVYEKIGMCGCGTGGGVAH